MKIGCVDASNAFVRAGVPYDVTGNYAGYALEGCDATVVPVMGSSSGSANASDYKQLVSDDFLLTWDETPHPATARAGPSCQWASGRVRGAPIWGRTCPVSQSARARVRSGGRRRARRTARGLGSGEAAGARRRAAAAVDGGRRRRAERRQQRDAGAVARAAAAAGARAGPQRGEAERRRAREQARRAGRTAGEATREASASAAAATEARRAREAEAGSLTGVC